MRRVLPILLAILGTFVVAAPAGADYYPGASLISADYDRLEQGDDATTFTALSADGKYAVLQTRARNFFADDDPDPDGQYRTGGIFRYELATKKLEKVADGNLFDEATNNLIRRGAANPAISADGRYVAFTTVEGLVPADTNDNVDVYVRDMTLPTSDPGAYDLVSAKDGGDVPATWGPPDFPTIGGKPGANISRGISISDDGQRVAFFTEVASDLPDEAAVDTPAGQLFVRDRSTNTTTLETVNRDTGGPAGGAVGAAISGDGSTVTWTGKDADVQTRFLRGEDPQDVFYYYLWRRIDDGPAAETRRITGLADPDDPRCPSDQQTIFDATSTGPCYGPLAEQEGLRSSIASQVPAISRDGYKLAYLTAGGPRPNANTAPVLDVWTTDMSPGVSRKDGTQQITQATSRSEELTSGSITGLAMTPDATHLAIVTARTTFAGGLLTPLNDFRAVPTTRELYAIDLEKMTIDRAAKSYSNADIDADVNPAVSIADGGKLIAFTSVAGNLFYGDANGTTDAFVVTRKPTDGTVDPPPPPPPPPPVTIEHKLSAKATSMPGGLVDLAVKVPTGGELNAKATGRVTRKGEVRSLAIAGGRSTDKGTIDLQLQLVKRYAKNLKKQGQIKATVHLDFVFSLGGDRIKDAVPVVFAQKAKRKR